MHQWRVIINTALKGKKSWNDIVDFKDDLVVYLVKIQQETGNEWKQSSKVEITCQVKSSDIETTKGTARRQIFADGPQPEITRNQICNIPNMHKFITRASINHTPICKLHAGKKQQNYQNYQKYQNHVQCH